MKLANRIKVIETQVLNASKENHLIERQKRNLQIKMFDLQTTNSMLMDEVNQFINQVSTMPCRNECDISCPQYFLCEKRILIVGGIIKMKQFYRKIVESGGGEFDYHDGYMQGGNKNLEARIARSDMILCPVNCNSHNACSRVKKLCKKYKKPVRMLSGSSLNSISSALNESFAGVQ